MRGITDTVKHLLIINVVMFIGTLAIKNGIFYNWFALHFPKSDAFQPWQIITHMFMHGNFMHIAFNMLALWMFGTAVEQVFGAKKFIFFYISAGLGAALVMLGVYYFQYLPLESDILAAGFTSSQIHETLSTGKVMQGVNAVQVDQLQTMFNIFNSSMVGASGAIFGVLVAFGMLYPESKLMLIFLPIPIKAKYFIPAIIALDLISAVSGQSFFSPNNTAYAAHLGGALTGFLMMWYWKKTQFNKNRWDR
ncbi:rhomboid family protein [Gelidibacter algens]|uniref:Rhomboid family protein n=1 Tax=Gelidibacter algens TaxID=49280 RepID=A0A1A7R579_9FLAO|nr:rhomboid family intramembrane serine protease [Gelidibacter algens]OBX25917.1 rhomboid family intramembrane serine protease [Gelidibacter algens]RAJ25284.1 rhomboid family protein [Gelidibacter algens]